MFSYSYAEINLPIMPTIINIIIIGLLKHIQTSQLQAELSLKYRDS